MMNVYLFEEEAVTKLTHDLNSQKEFILLRL